MVTKLRLFYLFCIFFPCAVFAQRPTYEVSGRSSTSLPNTQIDTLGRDSFKVSINKTINISKDALEDPVEYEAKDSIIFENVNNLVHLYGDAMVKFQTIEVKAAYIILNIKESLATAEAKKDSTGKTIGVPDFKDRDQTFRSQRMKYNFKTRKGIVYDVQTKQENLYVSGAKTKFVSRDATPDTSDTDVIYSQDAILTTCNSTHPHFGIRAKKLKVITNKMVIVGPSNLEIAGVATPIWLPFGFYPVSKSKHTGLIFPSYYGFRPTDGLGVENIGWYFPINEHFDAQVTGDKYSRGRWGLAVNTKYNYRYRFSGSFGIRIQTLVREKENSIEKVRSRPLNISWNHSQDAAARPNQSFSANLNIQTNAASFQRNVVNDFNSVSTNSNNSGINYSRNFPGKPFNFSAAITHNQNIRTHDFSLSPSINLNGNTIYPLRKLKRVGKDDLLNTVYEQFNFRYGAQAQANINTYDTLLFKKETYERRLRTAFKHSASASVPFSLFKIITVSPNASFDQTLNFDQVKKNFTSKNTYENVEGREAKLLSDGKIDTVKTWALNPVNTFNAGVSANATLFGTKQFRKGFVRGIRHKMDVSLGFNYSPNLTQIAWQDSVRAPRNNIFNPIQYNQYSVFEGSPYGSPLYNKNKGGKSLNIGTTHNVEIKIKGKKDSVAKKILLIRGLSLGTSIDLNRDSLKMSRLSPSLSGQFLKGLVNVNYQMSLTPYVQRQSTFSKTTWVDTDKYLWKEKSLYEKKNIRIPKPVELDGSNLTFSSSLSFGQIKSWLVPKPKTQLDTKKDTAATLNKTRKPNAINDATSTLTTPVNQAELRSMSALIDNFSFSYALGFTHTRQTTTNKDSLFTGYHTLGLRGSIPLSQHWNLDFGNIGYDFKTKQPTYAELGISRNLHCWDLGGSWSPTRGTFFFTLRVKDAPLDFIKYPIQKQNGDSPAGYRF